MKRILNLLFLSAVLSVVFAGTAFAADRFYVGNDASCVTPTWNTTSCWSTTDGGASGASVPGSSDTARFTSNSGAVTVTGDTVIIIQNIDLQSGFTGTINIGGYDLTTTATSWFDGGNLNAGFGTFTLGALSYVDGTTMDAQQANMVFNAELEVNSGSIDFSDATSVDFNGDSFAGLDFNNGTITGPLNGTMTFEDDFTQAVASTFIHNGCTLEFDGSTDSAIYANINEVNNVRVNKSLSTATLFPNAVNLYIEGDMRITKGTLNSANRNITLQGDWIMEADGDFTEGTRYVIFDGTNQTIYGSTTFYNLDSIETGADTLTFESGETQTVTGTARLSGVSGGLLHLKSDTAGVPASIAPNNEAIDYVEITDLNNSRIIGGDIDLSSTAKGHTENTDNGLNNTGWTFDNPYTAPVVPEFSTWLLVLSGIMGAELIRRKYGFELGNKSA